MRRSVAVGLDDPGCSAGAMQPPWRLHENLTAAVKIDWAADGRVSGGRSDRRPQGHIHGAEHDAAFERNHRNYQLISRKLRADWVDPF
jgi:hypothetical protein